MLRRRGSKVSTRSAGQELFHCLLRPSSAAIILQRRAEIVTVAPGREIRHVYLTLDAFSHHDRRDVADTPTPIKPAYDVVVIGGGNAAMCAALEARRAGCTVLVIEAAPEQLRGGNSRHTRNVRYMHHGPDHFLVGTYDEDKQYTTAASFTGGVAAAIGLCKLYEAKWTKEHLWGPDEEDYH